MEISTNQSQNNNLAQNDVLVMKLNHRQRKACIRKEKRKQKRQAVAKERDKKLDQEEEAKKKSPSYLDKVRQEEDRMKVEILRLEEESKRQRELWEWSEEIYKEKLRKKKEQEEKERLNRLEIERKIKEEWEERQKKEKEEEEKQRKKKEKQLLLADNTNLYSTLRVEERMTIVEELLKQAREGENKESEWHNPLAPVQYGQERVINSCPFFAKVGACRFGDRCSRAHAYPDNGKTILFTNMFRHFQLDQGLCEEYDTDIVLEYEDSEVYQRFSEFFEDTLPEFKAVGRVTQFKVCCNFQPHLRGNVYVSYSRDEDAMKAYSQFNARWYGGKQLSAQFVDIPSWKRAICGLFGKGCCPKGRECNFLHVFKNPTNEFVFADRDMENFNNRNRNDRHNNRFDKHSYANRSRRYSRSPSRLHRKHRSRSSERYRSSSRRSRSRDRKHNDDYHRRGRRSRYSRSRSRERGYSRSRSNSRDRKYSRSRSRERDYSVLKTSRKSRSRSRGKNYSRSKREEKSRSKSNSLTPERKRSKSRSLSRGKDSENSVNRKRSRSNERIDYIKTGLNTTGRKESRSRSNSPSKKRLKSRKKKQKEKRRNTRYSSDEGNSDYEEVWIEKTTKSARKN